MADYYIDPEYGSGGVGTDPADPYDQWSDLTLGSGDTVYFKRGTELSHPSEIDLVANATLSSYYNSDGTDDPTKPLPVLINTGTGHGVRVSGDSVTGCTVENLDIRGNATASRFALYVLPTSVTNTDYDMDFTVRGCKLSQGSLNVMRFFASGIKIYDCDMFDTRSGGSGVLYGQGNNIEIINSRFYGGISDEWVVFLSDGAGDAHVENCTIKGCSIISEVDGTGCLYIDSDNVSFGSNNIVEDNVLKYGSNPLRIAFSPECVVRRNLLISGDNTTDASAKVINAGSSDEIKIYNNVIVDTNAATAVAHYGAIYLTTSDRVEIYNNTVIGSGHNNSFYSGITLQDVTVDDCIVRNNIIVDFYNNLRMPDAKGHVESNNCCYGALNENFADEAGAAFTPTDGIEADPKLNADYTLQASSPCIGAGTTPLLEKDNDGKYRKTLSNDIGAKWFDAHEDSTVNTLLASGGTV